MTSQECNQAYEQLAASLRERRYGWIVSQVEETISMGRIRVGRAMDYSSEGEGDISHSELRTGLLVPIREDAIDISVINTAENTEPSAKKRTRRGRPVEIPQVQQYSPAERLQILLTAIRRALVSTAKMESEIAATLKRINPTIDGIVLQDYGGDVAHSVDLLDRVGRDKNAEQLDLALVRLKKMAN